MINKYEFVITPLLQEDGGGYFMEVPDLPGCQTDGETIEEAIKNGEEAINDWFESVIDKVDLIIKGQQELFFRTFVTISRVCSGIKQDEFSKSIGYSSDYVKLVERNRAFPGKAYVEKVAEFFDYPFPVLYQLYLKDNPRIKKIINEEDMAELYKLLEKTKEKASKIKDNYKTQDIPTDDRPYHDASFQKAKNIMKYNDYSAVIEYSDEDKCFVGKLLDIDALVIFEGESIDQLRRNFEEAVDDYIDFCDKLKDSQIDTKSSETRATFIMSQDQLEKIKAIAYLKRTTIKQVLAEAIEDLLTKKKFVLDEALRLYKERNMKHSLAK